PLSCRRRNVARSSETVGIGSSDACICGGLFVRGPEFDLIAGTRVWIEASLPTAHRRDGHHPSLSAPASVLLIAPEELLRNRKQLFARWEEETSAVPWFCRRSATREV